VVTPVVSVITTVFNGERFLSDSIGSVLAKEGVALELVVVDDGSDDATAEVLAAVTDPRVVVVHRPRQGRGRALNEAIAHSRGPYLAVQDADDRSLPGRLAETVEHLEAHPEVDLVGGGEWRYIDETGAEVGHRPGAATTDAELRRLLRAHHAPFPHSSVTVRRAAVDRVGGYDEDLLVDSDLDLYIRIAAEGRLATVPGALVAVRRHRGQYFDGRRGGTARLPDRVAARRRIDRRAHDLLGGPALRASAPAVALREVGSWMYWRGRRLAGPRPILPVPVRQLLDRRWRRGNGTG